MAQKTRDLGDMDGPVILFGGPYSNLRAVEALFARAREIGVPPARMICTGDICAYGAEPEQTVARIADSGCAVVAGNTDLQLGAGAADCGCGFEEGSACDLLSARWFAFADAALTPRRRAFLAGLPTRAIFTHGGARYAVIHGGASDVSRFIWPSDEDAVFQHEIELLELEAGPLAGVVCGHSGIPFLRQVGTRAWINAGAVGMGAHDGDPRGWFAVLDAGGVRMERLPYDAAGAAQAMRDAGLPEGYARALETGWWPNEDVLPAALRQPRGAGWAIATSSPAGAL